jgi:hypothetical protein
MVVVLVLVHHRRIEGPARILPKVSCAFREGGESLTR